MAYIPTIPQAGDLISDSQTQILANFTAIDSATVGFALDHVTLTDGTNGGKHNKVTFLQQSGDPTAVVGTAIAYTKSLTTNAVARPEIYVRQSDGTVTLLTRGVPSAASGQGVAYSGMMIRCGSGNGPGTNIAVSISPAFPTACLVAFAISNNNSRTWNTSSLTTSGFNANASSALGAGDAFFWIAIGY